MKTYETLRTTYPAYISIDQMSVICKMAKRSVRYLVDNGIVPAIDTGKKTWRWKIHIEDVIVYLQQRDKSGSMIPVGAVSSRKTERRKASYSQYVAHGQEQQVADYFAHIYTDYPDVLTTAQIGEMTGLNKKSITRIVSEGYIKVLTADPKFLIPKVYFLEYMVSPHFIDAWSNSTDFISILNGFVAWQNKEH